MNRSTSTYCQIYANITYNGAISRLTSTGKERDEETGYGYFGARFMDHELMTMWLSVDPMSDMAVGYTNFRTGFSNGDYGQMTRGGVEFLSGLTGAASFAAPPGPWKLGLSVTSTVLSTADLIFGGMIDERW